MRRYNDILLKMGSVVLHIKIRKLTAADLLL